ncbi:MAG: NAD(P) transhydrogenase subunit alpha [Clostridia bacterium]
MTVGIPKEIMHGENRVATTPETVAQMVKDGYNVLFEKGAGEGAFFHDPAYIEAGATIVADVAEIFKKSDVILKVKEPLFNEAKGLHEVDMMHKGQYLITFIHPANPINHEMVKKMAKQGVISITLDGVPRISRAQSMDALSSMSTCAGYKGIVMAADDIGKFMPLIGTAVGVIKPANVFVLGTGVAGLRAVATAKSLGAVVYSADIRPEANEQAKSLGSKIIDTTVPASVGVAADGKHANQLSEEWLVKERAALADQVSKSDIIFCSALLQGRLAPTLINEDMVKTMPVGSCIVDISIDQGGNCSITPFGTKEVKHNVLIEGIKNIPGLLPTSSTWMFSKNIYNLLKFLTHDGKIVLDMEDEIVTSTLVTINGEIVHSGAKQAMGIK